MTTIKPAFRFLSLFVGVYTTANVIYGFWVQSHLPLSDPFTISVTRQVETVLGILGEGVLSRLNTDRPTISLVDSQDDVVINVYEGCNGINVMIVFVAFMLAFGGPWKRWVWFVPVGLGCIHLANLLRVAALYGIARYYQAYFYYVHKYLFTVSIYFLVLLLWWFWLEKINQLPLSRTFTSSNDN